MRSITIIEVAIGLGLLAILVIQGIRLGKSGVAVTVMSILSLLGYLFVVLSGHFILRSFWAAISKPQPGDEPDGGSSDSPPA